MRKNKTKSLNTWNIKKKISDFFRAEVKRGDIIEDYHLAKLPSIYRFWLYILPLALVFSYHPVISLGGNETMNFELSLPLIWLVVFDVLCVISLTREKKWGDVLKGWKFLLLPIFLTLSVFWSLNSLRGFLTAGILWAIYLAGYGIYEFREIFAEEKFRKNFLKWFFGTGLFVCLWCVVQCVLDLMGVGRDYTLMCAGCTYKMFGFPHPNGFAIEPQFMGNILLAPAIVAMYLVIRKSVFRITMLFIIFASSIFLTFSRGAIYAFVVAMVVMVGVEILKNKNWRAMMVALLTAFAFILTLNIQGLMAQVSKTDDTYLTGVSKVINHLSLGTIKLNTEFEKHSNEILDENTLLNFASEKHNNEFLKHNTETAVFDGYVAESTDTRVKLTNAAIEVWVKNPVNMLFGVGIGGAGQALYSNGLSPAPKEIVQNEYASLLLETGIIGILLFIYAIYLVVRLVYKSPNRLMLLTLLIAYAVTLFFFAGLPNALHIYLLLPIIYSISLRKKLVS